MTLTPHWIRQCLLCANIHCTILFQATKGILLLKTLLHLTPSSSLCKQWWVRTHKNTLCKKWSNIASHRTALCYVVCTVYDGSIWSKEAHCVDDCCGVEPHRCNSTVQCTHTEGITCKKNTCKKNTYWQYSECCLRDLILLRFLVRLICNEINICVIWN